MNNFWKSYDITHAEYGADYRCYPLYGTVHLMELAISLAFIVRAELRRYHRAAPTIKASGHECSALEKGSSVRTAFFCCPKLHPSCKINLQISCVLRSVLSILREC